MGQQQPVTIKQALSQAKKAVKQGNDGRALELFNAVLQAEPNNPVAKKGVKKLQQGSGAAVDPSTQQLNALISLFQQGELTKLEYMCQPLLSEFPRSFQLINIMAAAQQGQGKLQAAAEYWQLATKLRPDRPEPFSNLGLICHQLGQFDDALMYLDKALTLKKDFSEAHYNRANLLRDLGDYQQALKSYSAAVRFKPDYAQAFCNRGSVYQEVGPLEKALEDFDEAVRLQPTLLEAWTNRGNTLKNLGRMGEATESYQQALAVNSQHAEAWRLLSGMKHWQSDDPQIEVMESIYRTTTPEQQVHSEISFALAKVNEDLGEFEKSFRMLEEGNLYRKRQQGYSIESDQQLFSRIRQLFSGSDVPVLQTREVSDKTPVFIVGMPRSGTSLVEQILASHSQVYGAGELHDMGRICAGKLLQIDDEITVEQVESVRKEYMEVLNQLVRNETVITDKMPINFRWIGFILTAFPDAKIIHCQRDARAVCWSIFKSYFSLGGNDYGHDLKDIEAYYRLYQQLMAFWEERFHGRIYSLDYEMLTRHQVEETQRLLNYCELDWEAGCLDFHETRRAVKTVSDGQVRQKMYTGSSEQWKRFKEPLSSCSSMFIEE